MDRDTITEIANWYVWRYHALLERATEAAITTGQHGVLVDHDTATISVSVAVPYGQIHHVGDPLSGPLNWNLQA